MLNKIKIWIKKSHNPIAVCLLRSIKFIKTLDFPTYKPFHNLIYLIHKFTFNTLINIFRFFYWTPLFKSQISNTPKQLYLDKGIPLLLGNLKIHMGNQCRVSGQTTISGRNDTQETPELIIGNNVDISWQNEIFVGRKITLGNNVRMAVKVRLVGYPGHPVDAKKRADGLPDTDDQIGDIHLENDVWLGAGVTVLGNVTIGAGTIVATGSVVTKNLPPNVLAAGIPAKIVKHLPKGLH